MTDQEDSLENIIYLDNFLKQKKTTETDLIKELSKKLYYPIFEGVITSVKTNIYLRRNNSIVQSDFFYIPKDIEFPKRTIFMSNKGHNIQLNKFFEEECKRAAVPFLLDKNTSFRKAKGYFCEMETAKGDSFPTYVLEISDTDQKEVVLELSGLITKAYPKNNSFRYIKKIEI
ncbi:hypothetical protein HN385_04215 [archaeon]|jgi:hypothetical protein|nr:hypothetical protein [archaeon]MBT3450448.1 hypothetical protein [archaeon]MBT6868995.1 hypothetical protein [archaeon]MBT7193261.1 hypothetical protein [archaeon]MBT7380116.1 hypothetical protein [archaeon]